MSERPLLLFFNGQQNRRIRVIQNLLIGKRTVSTLFWGMRYDLLSVFHTFKELPNLFNGDSLNELVNDKLLIPSDKDQFRLTNNGQSQFTVLNRFYNLDFNYNANQFYDVNKFIERFSLANQVISEYSYHQNNYYPLNVDWQESAFVKRWFHENKHDQIVSQWYEGLHTFLNQLPANNLADQFVDEMVGHNQIGATLVQQSEKLNLPVEILKLRQRLLMNQLISFIDSSDLSIFSLLLHGIQKSLLSQSAHKTMVSLMNGKDFNTIMRQRHLKISTVKEHILEAAILMPQLNINYQQFIERDHFEQFQKLLPDNKIDQWQYAKLKEKINGLTFFEFRLYQIIRSNSND